MPLISLLMPMRDARPYVEAAVRSVLTQEMPAGADLEIVVVDDGSTDGSADAVRGLNDPRVRIIPGPRQGISAAMNAALAAARGEWVCRCDADDLYPPGRLARQATWLADHPEFGAICGSFSTITAKGDPIADLDCGPTAEEVTAELLDGRTRTHLCTYLVRADAVRKAGGFRPWFVTAEDIDLQLRLGNVCRVWYDPTPAYLYRLHGASITHQQADVRRRFYEATARDFQHQRRTTGADDLDRGHPPEPPAATGAAARPSDAGRHVQ